MLLRTCVVLACAIVLAACSATPGAPPASRTADALPAAGADRVDIGRSVYDSTCARCHDTGAQGAPVAGRAADWAHRSRLWQAVLADHVEQGWFAMPARGGNRALTTGQAQAAAEYLLARSHRREPAD